MTVVGHLINGDMIALTLALRMFITHPLAKSASRLLWHQRLLLARLSPRPRQPILSGAIPQPIKRARVMFKFKRLLEHNADKICALIGEEHGKISHDAAGELQRGIENVEYACCAPELLKGEHSKNVAPNIDSWSEFQP